MNEENVLSFLQQLMTMADSDNEEEAMQARNALKDPGKIVFNCVLQKGGVETLAEAATIGQKPASFGFTSGAPEPKRPPMPGSWCIAMITGCWMVLAEKRFSCREEKNEELD